MSISKFLDPAYYRVFDPQFELQQEWAKPLTVYEVL
jgi:hypothetical protein